jgi:hypothetical protein
MPLNIGASGAIKPYVKFNAKADKWFAKGETGDVEIGRPTFVADLHNIATGWLRFIEGQAPERVIDPAHDQSAPNPGQGFKRGFVLAVYSQNSFGGVAELSSASLHVCNAIREIYGAFEDQRADHPGQVPVIACTGSEPMRDRYGVNYKPIFELVKWIDRPMELLDQSPVEPADIWRGAPMLQVRPQPVVVTAPTAPAAGLNEPEF